jgi:hypothetical protein
MRNTIEDIDRISKKHSISIEIIVGILAIVYLIYKMRSTLISGNTTFYHDNMLWNYPVFQFFAESILNNHFPFWNPFTHSGEPLYPILAQLRLFEPITLLTIYLGQFISNDIVLLFNWNLITKSLLMVFGVYIVFRPLTRHLFIRLSLIPILLFSSFMVVSFRQCGLYDQFILVPYVMFFLLRIVYYKDCRWHNWLVLAVTIGLNWQSYFFTGTWIFLLFFLSGFVLFRRDLLAGLFRSRMIVVKLAVMTAIIIAMATPSIILLLEKDKYVFPARMLDTSYEGKTPQGGPQQYEGESLALDSSSTGINMPYSFIAFTGTFSTIWDFIQTLSPDGSNHIKWSGRNLWGDPSEAYMYLGILPWFIAILGMVAGKHDLKKVWLLLLIAFGFLMLGPPGGLHRLMYYIYPPMWFVRHTHSFVLFFVFALIYFFILGFNHIFAVWGKPLFCPERSHGIISSFVNNKKYHKGVAICLFSACIIISVYWMARIEYPSTNYLFIFIILIFTVGWFLRNDLGKKGIYIGLIVSHIVIVFIFTTNSFKFARYILPILGLPLVLYLFLQTLNSLSASVKYRMTFLLLVIFTVCLTADLNYHFNKSSKVYLSRLHPGAIHNIETISQEPSHPKKRSIYPKYSDTFNNNYSTRYMSLIYRQPFVLSPVITNSHLFHPERLEYMQDGSGGSVEKYVYADGINDRKTSALLIPSSRGNSTLRMNYQDMQLDKLRGRYIRVFVMVKSQNKTLDAIQIKIHDGTGSEVSSSYGNSGDWECIELFRFVGDNVRHLRLTCSIKSTGTAGVYFNWIKVLVTDKAQVMPNKKNDYFSEFEGILKSKRWSSFLLLRRYFDLIHSDIPIPALVEMFAVDKHVFQFKKGFVQVKENKISDFLNQLGSTKAVKLLKDATILVDEKLKPSMRRLKMSKEKYDNKNQSLSNADFNNAESVSGVKREREFEYSIVRYEYDSCDMKLSVNTDGILYWADGYDKGWHAYVNKEEVPVYRANKNFKAIAIPKGSSYIRFRYSPYLFKAGLIVFYGTFIVSILAAVIFISFCNTRKANGQNSIYAGKLEYSGFC